MRKIKEPAPSPLRSAHLAEQLDAHRVEQAEAERQLQGLAEQRRGMLLTVDDAGLRKHDELIAEAKRRLDRATAWSAKLALDLQAALDDEADAPKRQAYDAAAQAAYAARHRLATEYPRLARELTELLTELVAAEAQVAAANEVLPLGAERLPAPERAVRDVPAMPLEVVSERQVERWVYAISGDLLDEQTASRVRAGDGDSGYLPAEGQGHPARVQRRSFVERRILKAEPSRHIVNSMTAEVRLPGLMAGEAAFWPPQSGGSSERVEIATYEPLTTQKAEAA